VQGCQCTAAIWPECHSVPKCMCTVQTQGHADLVGSLVLCLLCLLGCRIYRLGSRVVTAPAAAHQHERSWRRRLSRPVGARHQAPCAILATASNSPLGRLVLGSLLGLLCLIRRQTHSRGRPVQQALALQRACNIVRQLAAILESFSAHAVIERLQLGQARDRVQQSSGWLTCCWPASAYCEAVSAASEAAPFAES
jgi:hypothetical protein